MEKKDSPDKGNLEFTPGNAASNVLNTVRGENKEGKKVIQKKDEEGDKEAEAEYTFETCLSEVMKALDLTEDLSAGPSCSERCIAEEIKGLNLEGDITTIETLLSQKKGCSRFNPEERAVMLSVMKESEDMLKSIEGEDVFVLLSEEIKKVLGLKVKLCTVSSDSAHYRHKITEVVQEAIVLFDEQEERAIKLNRAKYWKTRGYILSESVLHHKEAAFALSKAVKLDPNDLYAWNKLGELYCFLEDLNLAEQCFIAALEIRRNCTSLHCLSILMRKIGKGKPDYMEKGMNYAKEAVMLDVTNNKSWTILGNAYLAEFFSSPCKLQSEHSLKKALQAYGQAKKGNIGDVEVAANSFKVLMFLEDYESALNCLLPCMVIKHVVWRELKHDYNELVQYLKTIQNLVDRKGKLSCKKRSGLVKNLNKFSSEKMPNLQKSDNILNGVVIGMICPNKSYPYTVAILDAHQEVFIVTIFNMNTTIGFKPGDILTVPILIQNEMNVQHCEYSFKFTKIRITCPMELMNNGKKLPPHYCVPFSFSSSQDK